MTRFRPLTAVFLSAALLGMSCSKTEEKPADAGTTVDLASKPARVAEATINDAMGNTIGTAQFSEHPTGSIAIDVHITKATPGKHGMHIHAEGLCEGANNFTSAGGHFNPGNTSHGDPNGAMHHAGDFGNVDVMLVGADGQGRLQIFSKTISLDPQAMNSVIDKSIIFHASEDDLLTQPTGNSGGRVGCGLIKAIN